MNVKHEWSYNEVSLVYHVTTLIYWFTKLFRILQYERYRIKPCWIFTFLATPNESLLVWNLIWQQLIVSLSVIFCSLVPTQATHVSKLGLLLLLMWKTHPVERNDILTSTFEKNEKQRARITILHKWTDWEFDA